MHAADPAGRENADRRERHEGQRAGYRRRAISALQHRDRDVARADLHHAIAREEARKLFVGQPEHSLPCAHSGNRRNRSHALDRGDHASRRVRVRGDRQPLREHRALERNYRLMLGQRLRHAR
jgi:hypothetical protein